MSELTQIFVTRWMHELVVFVSTGNMLDKQNFRPYPRPTESQASFNQSIK